MNTTIATLRACQARQLTHCFLALVKRVFPSLALALLTTINFESTALAAAGELDTSFAGTGSTRTGFGGGYDQAYAVAAQADGKLVMAGFSERTAVSGAPEFALVRLDTNNVLDASFGEGGKVLTPVISGEPQYADARVNALSIQADGKIIAAGYAYNGTSYSDFTLVRYNPNGSLDTTFGADGTGIVYTDFGEGSVIRAMEIQSDGRIVVAGYTTYSGNLGEGAVALARYQTNGTLDVSFGTGGTQITTGVAGYAGAHGLMIQSDGKIVAAGIGIGSGHGGIDFAVFRYTTNGFLDPSFGSGAGKVFTQISTNNNDYTDTAYAVATQYGNELIQSPDKIVVAGTYTGGFPAYASVFALARYNLDGSLDTTFGHGGIVTNAITSGSGVFDGNTAVSLVVQGSLNQPRKITVGGFSSANGTKYFTLVRYNSAGAFDTTFGTNGTGKVIVPFNPGVEAVANAMVVQSGKLVLAGYTGVFEHNYDFAAARFNSDGSPDTNFGAGGVLAVDITDLDSKAQGVVIQPDGRIVVAGSADNSTNNVFALARYNSDGSLDTNFGMNGKLMTVVGTNDSIANAVRIQSDGKIVAAGSANSSGGFAIVRYNINGSLDTTFGSAGKVITPGGGANAMAIQPDGKIVIAGSAYNGANNDVAVVRYGANGLLDTSFGGTGKVITAVGAGDEIATALMLQTDGKIVVAGSAVIGTSYDFVVLRYTTSGLLDDSFGTFGRATTDFDSGSLDEGLSMVIQPDGKTLVGGLSASGPVTFAAARYNTNGALDNSFNGDGKVTTTVGIGNDYGSAIALQPDGKIIMAGYSFIGALPSFAAVRYNPNGSLDTSYGTGGRVFVEVADAFDDVATALALDSMGRAVIVGDAGGLFGIARLTGDPHLKISLTPPNTVVVSWPWPSTGWSLQQSTDLGTTNWVAPAETINHDGTNNFILVNGPVGNRFYRLKSP